MMENLYKTWEIRFYINSKRICMVNATYDDNRHEHLNYYY
jgi:hypothetical protein